MRILLDTHAVLWYYHEPEQLNHATKNAIESAENSCLISAVSFWEIAIKAGLGKLKLPATTSLLFCTGYRIMNS